MTKNKIIVDTDPGIDDAMAILFALAHPGIDLVGLTTIFGNVATPLATANALRILEIGNSTVPVCEGEQEPLTGAPNPYPDWVHGADGLGNIDWPEARASRDPRAAVDFIADIVSASPGEITLVPVGPLTNIARLVELRPEVVRMVREVVIMGGAALHPGNVTPLAEANVANDPEAADIVFGATWPVVMIGLDVTQATVVDADSFAAIARNNQQIGTFLGRIAEHYIKFYRSHLGVDGCSMHDVCAVAHIVEPQLFNNVQARIRVVCEGIARGKTVVMPPDFFSRDKDWLARPLQHYAAGLQHDALLRLFVGTLGGDLAETN